jgi:hypothetical protein
MVDAQKLSIKWVKELIKRISICYHEVWSTIRGWSLSYTCKVQRLEPATGFFRWAVKRRELAEWDSCSSRDMAQAPVSGIRGHQARSCCRPRFDGDTTVDVLVKDIRLLLGLKHPEKF